jgi:hypothetical protein
MLTKDAATTVVYYGRVDAFMTSTQVQGFTAVHDSIHTAIHSRLVTNSDSMMRTRVTCKLQVAVRYNTSVLPHLVNSLNSCALHGDCVKCAVTTSRAYAVASALLLVPAAARAACSMRSTALTRATTYNQTARVNTQHTDSTESVSCS